MKWLSFPKRKKGPIPPQKPLLLLQLEERNSASAFAGLEGMVLFGSGASLGRALARQQTHDSLPGLLVEDTAASFLSPHSSSSDSVSPGESTSARAQGSASWDHRDSRKVNGSVGQNDSRGGPGSLLGNLEEKAGVLDELFGRLSGRLDSASRQEPLEIESGSLLESLENGRGGSPGQWTSSPSSGMEPGSTDLGASQDGVFDFSIGALNSPAPAALTWALTANQTAPMEAGPVLEAHGDQVFTSWAPEHPFLDSPISPTEVSGEKSNSVPVDDSAFSPAPADPGVNAEGDAGGEWGAWDLKEAAGVQAPSLGGTVLTQGGAGIMRLETSSGAMAPGFAAPSQVQVSGSYSVPNAASLAQITVSPVSLSVSSPTVSSSNQLNRPTEGTALQSQTGLFRVQRVSGPTQPLQVHYTLSAFEEGNVRTIERTAVMASGQMELNVTAGNELDGVRPQVVTLKMEANGAYRVATPLATHFLSRSASQISGGALLEAYRLGGSQEAFDSLVAQYWQGVFRTCHRILGQWTDAEDVSQFVFLALTQLNTRFPSQLSRWLHRVAKNASIGLLRSRKRRERREQASSRPDRVESQELNLERSDLVDFALNQLPENLKEAVTLRYMEGWSQQEAADRVGCPRGTLSQRTAHGIEKLRGILAKHSA